MIGARSLATSDAAQWYSQGGTASVGILDTAHLRLDLPLLDLQHDQVIKQSKWPPSTARDATATLLPVRRSSLSTCTPTSDRSDAPTAPTTRPERTPVTIHHLCLSVKLNRYSDRLRTHTRSAHGRNNLLPGEAPPANFRALVRVEAAGGPFVNLPPRPVAPAANPPPAGPLVALLPAPVVVAAPAPPPAMAPPPVIMAAPPVIMAAPPAQQQQQQQQQPLPPPPFANPLPPPRTYPSTPFMTNRVTDESTSLALRQLA
ncbi:hypothetical protein D6C83_03672 [Aureobasidium pullulans]|uniref:Uncharacterized protein n=1 Tax=Aureobasidium pullulans TaxID=5580 RepID=A0A4T0DAT8_AURPU|nr:hypothetical protein D6C83_03672 [Aureobasidium pullulans]